MDVTRIRFAWFIIGMSTWIALSSLFPVHYPNPDPQPPVSSLGQPTAQIAVDSTKTEPEDPDESQKIVEAIKAKSNVIHNCAVTGYAPELVEKYKHMNSDGKGNYLTASGQWVRRRCAVAVDPNVIPLGATVVIGDDVYLALDTGVIGNVVDILMSPEEALEFGVSYQDVWWVME